MWLQQYIGICVRALGAAIMLSGFTSPVAANSVRLLQANAVDWPPFYVRGTGREVTGLAADLLQRCLESEQVAIKYQWLPIKRTFQYMAQGKLDIAVYSYKPERETSLWYGKEPIFSSGMAAVVRHDFPEHGSSFEVLAHARIGYLAGVALPSELQAMLDLQQQRGIRPVELYQLDALTDALQQQPASVDAVINTEETLRWLIHKKGLQQQLKVLPWTLAQKQYYVTVSKNSTNIAQPQQFLAEVDACLQQLKANGQYQHILERHGLSYGP